MPDEPQDWSSDQMEAIHKWLEDKWGKDRKCSQCGTDDWGIGGTPGSLPVGTPEGRTRIGPNYPCVVVICSNCGNTILLNALAIGVQPPIVQQEAANG
jgi:hypothetical protein